MYKYFNPNPNKGSNVGDCVIRAIALATKQTWEDVYIDLATLGYSFKDMPSSNHVWSAYLKSKGFARYAIPNDCPDCYTVRHFCEDNPQGLYVLATGTHVVTVIDGDYYDAWDSGSESPVFFFEKR